MIATGAPSCPTAVFVLSVIQLMFSVTAYGAMRQLCYKRGCIITALQFTFTSAHPCCNVLQAGYRRAERVAVLCACRIPLYANSLLLAARKHPNFLAGLQRHLAAFMAESAAKRYALPSMPREVRLPLLPASQVSCCAIHKREM